jgi:hypothetical protein
MHPGANIAHQRARPAIATTRPPLDATPESPPHAAPRRPRPTRGDASAPAERARVTDCPLQPGGRELERDGRGALGQPQGGMRTARR